MLKWLVICSNKGKGAWELKAFLKGTLMQAELGV